MTRITEQGGPARYLGFLKWSGGILTALLTLGYLPTMRLAGERGILAMVAGCGVSLASSVAGTMPFLLVRGRSASEAVPVLLGSIALRLIAVLTLAGITAWVGLFANKPFLLWVAISHVSLLVADTLYARAEVRARTVPPAAGATEGGAGA